VTDTKTPEGTAVPNRSVDPRIGRVANERLDEAGKEPNRMAEVRVDLDHHVRVAIEEILESGHIRLAESLLPGSMQNSNLRVPDWVDLSGTRIS
jgi:hypothetical protein